MAGLIFSFDAVADDRARVLILGTIPGVDSLAAGEYYAHRRNGFWPIMLALLGGEEELSYEGRLELLRSRSIALWDMLAAAERRGSLDASIRVASLVPNDIASFLERYPLISHIFFNGARAEALFRRYVRVSRQVCCLRLPSTSPAHASCSFQEKLDAWRQVVVACGDGGRVSGLADACPRHALPGPESRGCFS